MISKRIKCRDGFSMSVQANQFTYCSPRMDGLGFYNAYEVGFPSAEEPMLLPYAEDRYHPTETVYGYVPAWLIADIIAAHGGVVGTDEGQVDDL